MNLDIPEIHTKYWNKYITMGITIVFTISFGFISILNYINNIPIPIEIKIGISLASSLIGDFPNNINNFLKKTPP